MTDFHVYILEWVYGSFYTGNTGDLEQRLGQHQAGTFVGYMSLRRPATLLWSTVFSTREDAFAFERHIKNSSLAKKIALIANDWAAIKPAAMPPGERERR